jgi:hypothetical protein
LDLEIGVPDDSRGDYTFSWDFFLTTGRVSVAAALETPNFPPLSVDGGEHVFRFEREGSVPMDQKNLRSTECKRAASMLSVSGSFL